MANKKLLGGIAAVAVVAAGVAYFTMSGAGSDKVTTWLRNMPLTYNYAKIEDVGSADVLGLTGATPLTLDKEGKLKNYAASNIEVSKDAKTVTVTLKDGLKYSDGTEVKAQDYLTTAKLIANPKVKASYAGWVTTWIKGGQDYADGKSSTISGFKVLNDKKYEIDLTGSYGFFKSTLSSEIWSPVPEKQVTKAGGMDKYGLNYTDILASGEYKISKLAKDQYVDLVKNEKSVLASKTAPKEIRMKYYANPTTWYTDFKNGKINWTQKNEASDKILGKSKATAADYKSPSPSMSYLAAGEIDKDSMKALYSALDKNYINKQFFYGNYTPRYAVAPSGYEGLDAKLETPNANKFDLAAAKKQIKVKNVTLQVYTERTPQQKDMEKYIVAQWAKLGVTTNIVEKPFAVGSKEVFTSPTKQRSYQVAIVNWSPDYLEPSTFYASILGNKQGTSYASWNNSAAYDKQVGDAMGTPDVSKANASYAAADKIAHEEGKLFTIFQQEDVQYIKKGGFESVKNGRVLKPSEWTKK